MKTLVIALFAVALYGCSGGRPVGDLFDPACAADGSIVKYQLPNSQGSYEGATASKENASTNNLTIRSAFA